MTSVGAADVFAVVDDLDVGGAAVLRQRVERELVNSGSGRPENSGGRVEAVSGIHVRPVEGDVALGQKEQTGQQLGKNFGS